MVAIGIGASSSPAFAELRTFLLTWTAPDGGARGTLTLDDEVCNNPGVNNALGPEGCFVAATFTVTGDVRGKGTYTLDDLMGVSLETGVLLDLGAEIIAQGPNDVNFFSNGSGPGGTAPFTMAAAGAEAGDVLTLVSMVPLPFPLAADAAKCAGAVGKAGSAYFNARHKALYACRTALTKGSALFADEAKTVPVAVGAECAAELKAASKIAKARTKLRRTLAKKCSDAALATVPTCAATVDLLVDPTAQSGCVLETVDFNLEKLIHAEFGF